MIISDLAVRYRIPVFFLSAVVFVVGMACYRSLPLESAPDVNIPNVFVTTTYRGVAPEDVEQAITIPIEKKLKGISGVKKISSISSEGLSQINIEFQSEIPIEEAKLRVKDKVDLAKADLPKDLEDDPVITEINFSELPILQLALAGPCGIQRLTQIAEDLKEEIEGIRGVLEVEIVGHVKREIQIQVFPDRLALYGVPFTTLQAVIAGENQNVSGGSFRTPEGSYQLRVPSEFKSLEELESLVLSIGPRGPVYLRDVAKVVDGIQDRTSVSRLDGEPAVTLLIKKRIGENIVTIVDAVHAVVEKARPTWPAGTKVTSLMDRAKDIRLMVEDLENNFASGLLLVISVVCLALGLQNALVVSLSIPLSMLITFILLKALGITLNMVVLFSLTLAMGMLVDNAIVITENIYRFTQQGVPKIEAAMRATSEVAWPIIGSSATTIAAFLPLLAWTGIMGGFMIFLPKTVILTLTSCLFVSLVMSPAFAAVFLKPGKPSWATLSEGWQNGGEHPLLSGGGCILEGYRRLLRGALRMHGGVVLFAATVMIACFLFWLLRVGLQTPMEFFPSIEPHTAYINLKMPEGASLAYADAIIQETAIRLFAPEAGSEQEREGKIPRLQYAEAITPKVHEAKRSRRRYESPSFLPNIEHILESASTAMGQSMFMLNLPNHLAIQFVKLEERTEPTSQTLQTIERRLKSIAGAEIRVEKAEEGPPTGAPIHLEISGDDFSVLGKIASAVKAQLETVEHLRNIRSDLVQGAPTIRVEVDRKKAAFLGLSSDAIGFALKAAINGIVVSTFREGDEEYDITVRIVEEARPLIETLRNLLLPSPKVGLVPLTTVASIHYAGGMGSITRIQHRRTVTIKADVDETKTTSVAARSYVQSLLAKAFDPHRSSLSLPPGYRITFTGEFEFQKESEDFLSWAMGIAILLILFLLVLQFNSILRPCIILTSVLLSFSGVFLGLGLARLPFNIIMSGVGVISLAGVVVNNAIVLVDYTIQLMKRGMSRDDAIVAAGATRLRPVLLTAITTILGLIPMATGTSFDFHTFQFVFESESTMWWRSMAIPLIFGLGIATLLTLVVVPVLFRLEESIDEVADIPRRLFHSLVAVWWRPFDRLYGTHYADRGKTAERISTADNGEILP